MNTPKFTARARQAIDAMFTSAARANFRLGTNDGLTVESIDELPLDKFMDLTLIVFTMATFTFKITAIFHVPPSLSDASRAAADGVTLLDTLIEQGNLCCGATNRALLSTYPCMGVSSPTILQGFSSTFDAEVDPESILRYALDFGGATPLYATLHLCPYADIDIAVPTSAVVEVVGELEMF